MFNVQDSNGNVYHVYHVQMVSKNKTTSDGQELTETEIDAMFMIYNPFAKEWQWSYAGEWKPVEVSIVGLTDI